MIKLVLAKLRSGRWKEHFFEVCADLLKEPEYGEDGECENRRIAETTVVFHERGFAWRDRGQSHGQAVKEAAQLSSSRETNSSSVSPVSGPETGLDRS